MGLSIYFYKGAKKDIAVDDYGVFYSQTEKSEQLHKHLTQFGYLYKVHFVVHWVRQYNEGELEASATYVLNRQFFEDYLQILELVSVEATRELYSDFIGIAFNVKRTDDFFWREVEEVRSLFKTILDEHIEDNHIFFSMWY